MGAMVLHFVTKNQFQQTNFRKFSFFRISLSTENKNYVAILQIEIQSNAVFIHKLS